MTIFQDDEFIRVRDIQRIKVDPDELLIVKLGVEGMNQEQIEQYVHDVALTLRDNLPGLKMMITTVTNQNPFDLFAIKDVRTEKADDSE